jgi:putative transposase
MSYWNNRRICSANGGLPPMVKRKKFYERQYAKTA